MMGRQIVTQQTWSHCIACALPENVKKRNVHVGEKIFMQNEYVTAVILQAKINNSSL